MISDEFAELAALPCACSAVSEVDSLLQLLASLMWAQNRGFRAEKVFFFFKVSEAHRGLQCDESHCVFLWALCSGLFFFPCKMFRCVDVCGCWMWTGVYPRGGHVLALGREGWLSEW